MANIPSEYREYLTELRALSKDECGEDVLVGLTSEETEFYLAYSFGKKKGERSDHYLQLNDKHELARRDVLLAENEFRVGRPRRH